MSKRNKNTAAAITENVILPTGVAEIVSEVISEQAMTELTSELDNFLKGIDQATETLNADAAELAVLEAEALQAAEAAAAQELIDNPPVVEEETETVPEVAVVEHVEGVMKEMVEAVPAENVTLMLGFVKGEFDNRGAFELTKNPDNDKMQANLKGYAKKFDNVVAAAVLCAIDIDPSFLNREVSAGSRYNVYAIDKVQDVVKALGGAFLGNAINRAVMQSMFKFRAAGVPFTGLMAVAAASDKVKVDAAMDALLIRHTVSPGTAPTQSSSTMSALQVLGVVINRGSQKYPLWSLTDTPQTRRLEEVLAA